MVCGYMLQAVANVDLAADQKPSGAAAAYYIFANRADDSTAFTLTVSTSITEIANQRRIGRFYWDGAKIIQDSVRTEFAVHITDLLYFIDPQICDGRLTASTGVSVPDSDIASSATVYFTPHIGNRISLYVPGYGWRLYTFSELSLDISGIADAKNFDVWIYDNAGTLTLAYTEWNNDTLRATAIVRQDGVYCKTGALNYRLLGTVRTSGAGVTADSLSKRFVINYLNRRPRKIAVRDATANWTYDTATYRQMRATAANKVEFVVCVSEDPVFVRHSSFVQTPGAYYPRISIGLDAVNAVAADSFATYMYSSSGIIGVPLISFYNGYPGIGYHYLAPIEYASGGAATFYGGEHQLFEGVIYG